MIPSLDLKEKQDLLVRREDIISAIRTNIVDGEILDDIVEDIERQVIMRTKELARVTIPFIGAFVPNENKLAAIESAPLMKMSRDTLDKEEYYAYRRSYIDSIFKIKKGFRSRTIVISKTVRLNRKHALDMMSKFKDDRWYKLYFYFYANMRPTNSLEYYSNNLYYDTDRPFRYI